MILNGEEGLECEVYVDGILLEYVSEFKCLGCVLDESGTDEAECIRKMTSGKRVVGAIRSLVNASLSVLVLQETLLVPVLTYCSETMLWNEKERSIIRAVQMDNLRGLLGIRRMNGVLNARIRELCGMTKRVKNMIDEFVLKWFGHVDRMENVENDRIPKRIYTGECAGSHSVGRPRKRLIGTVKNCLRKRGLDVRQVRKMVYNTFE